MESYIEQFLNYLGMNTEIAELSLQTFAGIPFLSVKLKEENQINFAAPQKNIQDWIKAAADHTSESTILSYECRYVRQSNRGFIFLFRFLLPNEKMFCCGNLCVDCVLKQR